MRSSETVTFGGSDLDRAAHLRGGGDQDALASGQAAVALLFWRGKPLFSEGPTRELVRLPLDHPIFSGLDAPIFLGIDQEALCFAHRLRNWEPEEGAPEDLFFDKSEQSHPELAESERFCELRAIMTELNARDAELAATARSLFAWHDKHGFCSNCGQASKVAQSGWQRDCPACGVSHFPRTDPVVIMLITHANRVLVGRSPGWPTGMYSLLAGFVEPGETPEAAVRREVFEEAGVRVGAVSYLLSQPWAFPSSLMMGYQGIAISDEISIDPNEIEDAIWLTREEMMEAMAGQNPKVRPARAGSIAQFILRNWLADCLD